MQVLGREGRVAPPGPSMATTVPDVGPSSSSPSFASSILFCKTLNIKNITAKSMKRNSAQRSRNVEND